MPASIEKRKETEEKRQRAWELHIAGEPQYRISKALEVSQPTVARYIQEAARMHPINRLSIEERMAISEERWNISEREIIAAIREQQANGRIVRKMITLPDGRRQTEITKIDAVDPALLRALSTHHDRRARQLNNQLSPDAGMQQVNISLVKDFISQGDTSGKLTAAQWNEQAIDA